MGTVVLGSVWVAVAVVWRIVCVAETVVLEIVGIADTVVWAMVGVIGIFVRGIIVGVGVICLITGTTTSPEGGLVVWVGAIVTFAIGVTFTLMELSDAAVTVIGRMITTITRSKDRRRNKYFIAIVFHLSNS